MQDLLLSVKRSQFRHDDPESDHADKAFRELVPEVLRRDDYSCQYCGFQAKKYQEVHHLDDNHHHNDKKNLVTTCCLCHSVNHLGFSAKRNAGVLIFLPPSLGVTQAQINALARVLWVMEKSGDQEAQLSSIAYQSRLNRLVINARRQFGTADLSIIADVLLSMNNQDYSKRDELFAGLYFLPQQDAFSTQLEYWVKEVFNSMKVSDWLDVAEEKSRRWLLEDGDQSEYALAKALGIV